MSARKPVVLTEWGLRADEVILTEPSEGAARRAHATSPDATLVSRTVTYDPWVEHPVIGGAPC